METPIQEYFTRSLNRRISRRGFLTLGTGVAGAALLAACGGSSPASTATGASSSSSGSASAAATTGPKIGASPAVEGTSASTATDLEALPKGGVLKIGVIGEPPAMADAMFTTATITSNVATQIFEGLMARDSRYAPQPMLAEKVTASADGKTFEFTLRNGVKFHNGKDMTSADVASSLKRWGNLTGRGKQIMQRVGQLETPDASTIKITFTEPTGVLLDFLALAEAFVLPAEIADAYPKDKLPEDKHIGTGPFKFTEHQVDRFIRLTRYDDYAARSEAPDGAAGKKVAVVDELQIVPVPDDSVRVNGVVTGEYHFADTVPPDQYDSLKSNPDVDTWIVKPYYWYCPHFNKQQGLFTDKRLRQAVALSFSAQEAMVAGFGREEFIRMDASVAAPETVWHSDMGTDTYNHPDPAKAKQILQEAGYTGQTVRWLTTKEYAYNFNMANFVKQKMEDIGMKVELVVSDWATLVQNRSKPEVYEIFLTGHSGYSHPATQPFNDKAWPGFWDNAEKDQIVSDMIAEPDPQKQQAIIDKYQALIYEEWPFVKCGDNFLLRATSKNVKGYTNPADWFFWNVGLAK